MAGCGADLLINICLTILGYFPGHIHAFYLLYVQHNHRETGDVSKAGGVFSPRIYAPAGAKVQQPMAGDYTGPAPGSAAPAAGYAAYPQETGTAPYAQQAGSAPYTQGGAVPPPSYHKS